jgi:hypothetical protein
MLISVTIIQVEQIRTVRFRVVLSPEICFALGYVIAGEGGGLGGG